jgi:hypothetical protein
MASAQAVAEQIASLTEEYERSRAFLEALEASISKREEQDAACAPVGGVEAVIEPTKQKSTFRRKLSKLFGRSDSRPKGGKEPAKDDDGDPAKTLRQPSVVDMGASLKGSGSLLVEVPALVALPRAHSSLAMLKSPSLARSTNSGLEDLMNPSQQRSSSGYHTNSPKGALTPTLRCVAMGGLRGALTPGRAGVQLGRGDVGSCSRAVMLRRINVPCTVGANAHCLSLLAQGSPPW